MTETTAERKQKEITLTAADVANYLRQNPGFFSNRPDILYDMELPHAQGSASSLLERQANVLRTRNTELRHKLNDFVSIARDNDRLFNQIKTLGLSLLEANSVAEISSRLRQILTKDFITDDEKAMTITFSRGVGGAVSGQSGESYIVSKKGSSLLLSPARDIEYVSLDPNGGMITKAASFETPILNSEELRELYETAKFLRTKLKKSGMKGPYDIELGIADKKIWLFQARPLAESKKGQRYSYLNSIDDKMPVKKKVMLKGE